jgi:DNA-binding PadR family transcriptional regulator
MINTPKGVLKLAALKLLSESSLSGTGLAQEVARVSSGEWKPGPGSIYLVLGDLLKDGLITELPKREGNIRRYVVSKKGKEEVLRASRLTGEDVRRQLRLLALYSGLSGRDDIRAKLLQLAKEVAD